MNAKNKRARAVREAKPPLMERIRDRLWDLETEKLPWPKRRAVEFGRIVYLALNGFMRDECAVRASGLIYYSMISLVPVLVMALALARIFGGEKMARQAIVKQIDQWAAQSTAGASSPEANEAFMSIVGRVKTILDSIFDRIADIHFGTLGGIGLIVLLWSAIEMMTRVEESMNRIWGVTGRTLWRRFADYLTIMLIVPFLFIAATTLPMVTWFSEHLAPAWHIQALNFSLDLPGLGTLFTLIMLTVLFTFLVAFIPNTRVRLVPGIVGGLVTALASMAWIHLCASLQIGVVKYGRLYGGFAAGPILLAWTYVSWEIILLGAEVAFAIQNVRTYGLEDDGRNASPNARAALALEVVAMMARDFEDGVRPFDSAEFSSERRISIRCLNDILEKLALGGIIAELAGSRGRYVLIRAPAHVTAGDVIAMVMDHGLPRERIGLRELDPGISRWIGDFAERNGDAMSLPITGFVEAGGRSGKEPAK